MPGGPLSPLDQALVRDGIARAAKLNAAGEHEAAASAARQALVREPQNPEAICELGTATFLSGQHDEAIGLFHRALQLRPRSTDALAGLSRAFRAAGRLPEALDAIQMALAIATNDIGLLQDCAELLATLGRSHEAMAAYRSLLEIAPGDDGAAKALATLAATTAELAPPDFVAGHFDRYAPIFEDHLVNTLGYVAPQTIASLLPDTLGEVLDLGCGTGLVAAALAGRFSAIDGVDLSERMVALARDKGLYRELHVDEAVAHLSATERRYDLIVAAEVFNYLSALEAIFDATARCLRPNGRFVFSTETSEGADYVLQPTGRYTQATAYIERVGAGSGFRIETAVQGTLRLHVGEPVLGSFHVLVRP
jgi:predicted TPR repeat methyltransferase